jgi:Family of unknown function (DUF6600)
LEILVGFLPRLWTALAFLTFCASETPAALAQIPSTAVQRPPAAAVDFDYFLQRLSSYGRWLRHPAWGDVWQPDAGVNFRPYFYGYWQYTTDYGWLWVSNEPYGDVVYHYGRWAYDPNFGWIWVPGYVWGPSWVAWRDTGDYIGWLPMPPGYQDFSPGAVTPSYNPGDWYGYQYFYGNNFPVDAFERLWLFVPNQDFGRRDRRPYVFDKDKVRDLYRRSHDRTRYDHDRDHDRVVDRSIDKDELERSTHRSFGAQEGRQFMRRDTPITSVTEGQEIARRSRDRGREGFGPPGGLRGQTPPASGAGAQTGAVQPDPGTTAPGPRRVGRGLFAVPPDNSSGAQAGTQNAPAGLGIVTAPTAGSQTAPASRGRGRTLLGRNLPPAAGQVAPNGAGIPPPTDGFAGAQGPPQPGTTLSVPQSPTVDGVQTTPSGVRVRRFGSAPVMPRAIVPPNVATVASPPAMSPPAVGLQRGLAFPVPPPAPIVPPPAAVVPLMPAPVMQSQPAPVVQTPIIVPQATAPAPQAARPLGRGLMGGFQVP